MPSLEYAAGADLPLAAVVRLYDAVGWSAYTDSPQTLAAALAGSTRVAVAWEDAELVGLARVVSDGHSICYLQDILVDPRHQRTGLGRQLAELVLAPFAHVRQKVLLTDTEPGQKAFYEALGYRQAGGEAADDDGGLPLRAFVRFDA
ncbi:GNAT family N-acetyltransferase [Arthrobacter jiangjiafuii]|uniref:GNAT family N-acetyltransferase n=1 Tax=Arthrobacter jiangjiafuii TaxID=2817475 RepID=A0A975M7N9_9MICC|nr:GNAT family N-acetyltransferase [Arthrobacter jiangjiafuii]MBP3044359.1 GNAT family N-acetyltransferase [Arthrobacter jiangjiafuii]QWC11310.1 GNAT family N-acetyltransferase [Arthrobacter jiangjiafuii]